MTDRPHIVVLHRWRAHYALYDRYLDHSDNCVTYITTEVGAGGVPPGAAETVVVPATDDLVRVRKELDGLAARHGGPRSIVALKEDDLLVAAQLALEWNCCARRPWELLPFRDKLLMAAAVSQAGLAVPTTAEAPDEAAVRAFLRAHGGPVVVKPRIGSSSEGVVRLDSGSGVASLSFAEDAPLIVQSHNPHPIYHVDGIFDGQDLMCWKASRYLSTCLDFRAGQALGSVEEDRPEVLREIGRFTTRALHALTSGPTPFHLELFVRTNGKSAPTCTFLEAGARVGGAEIPYVWRDIHNYDLMEAAFRIALGRQPQPLTPKPEPETGGWLLVPAPATRPCVITAITPMTARESGPYAEDLLREGDVLPDADAYYEHVGGRFRFRGTSSAAVQRAIEITARDFRVTGETCGGPR
ncbi:acetyl-CoA carboxylase biotin carboxylase subunit family protein [Streptomyces uncialis]|uniref:ATP-grasp domain-containing protein n=1 Tax=Streptomyces uncialis TaxID=1048205 RepID=UPI00366462F3